ncbi:MAG: FtsL-like putative cell division protein [Bacteroidaceae bacterium]
MTEGVGHQNEQTFEPQEVEVETRPTEERKLAGSVNNGEDGENNDAKHLRELLAALQVDGMWFKRHIPVFLLIFVAVVAYVTNNYQAQQEILLEETLNDSVKDCKYRCLTRESELTRRTRQSQLERQLRERGDSTLVSSKEPPFLLTNE